MKEGSKGTILYVGNFHLPDKGASANRVVSNGKIFKKLGYQIAFLGVTKDDFDGDIQLLDRDRNMHQEKYPRSNGQWLKHMVSVDNMKALAEEYGDVKMIILYNTPYTLLVNAKKTFQKMGIKVVYDCTEWTGVTDGSLPKRIIKRMDEFFIRNRIQSKADGLIVISSMMEKQYSSCENMIKLPPLVDLDDPIWHQGIESDWAGSEELSQVSEIQSSEIESRQNESSELQSGDIKSRQNESSELQSGDIKSRQNEVFEFCFAGMLDGDKESLDIIVDAFNRLKEGAARLRIIGVTEDEFCRFYDIGSQFVESGNNEIIFMGTKTHKETIKYVSNCGCYIFIRKSDRRNNAGFPTKFSESYSCGVPIIATDISDIRDYLDNGYFVEHLSVEEVRDTMKKAMAEHSAREPYKLNRTFHYEEYLEYCDQWLSKIFN